MYHTLIGAVIPVGEENHPIGWEGGRVNSVAMVLGGDETATSSRVDAGLVLTSIPISAKTQRTLH